MKILALLAASLITHIVFSQDYSFPKESWDYYKSPNEAGWNEKKLDSAKAFYDSINSAGVLVIYKGKVLIDWGQTDRNFICHSMRKSFMSMLYGYYMEQGILRLDETLESLNIDDTLKLTALEKSASIENLLMSNSGIYHPAAAEAPQMRALRPERGSHKPGEYWYYNNWGFNVLGAILEQKTKESLYESFDKVFAKPLQMEHYKVSDSMYQVEAHFSKYPAYHFLMSAKDLARLGLLMLNNGKWENQQLLTEAWVKKSTSKLSTPTDAYKNIGSYGYLWWICDYDDFKKYGMYSALGYGDHSIDVLPGLDMVFVHRTDTFSPQNRVTMRDRLKLLKMIIDAKSM